VVPDPAAGPRRKGSFTSRALILLLVLAVLGVSYASSIRAWLNLRSEQHTLSAQIAAQQAAIASLRHMTSRLNDPAYIETLARLRFGWVMPGERSFRVIGKDGKVLSAGTNSLTEAAPGAGTAQPPWWAGVTGSLARADALPRPVKPGTDVRHPATLIGPTPGHPTGR